MERPTKDGNSPEDGLIVQVVEFESISYDGMMQETIQHLLEQQIGAEIIYDREMGMDGVKSLKLARARIRKRSRDKRWRPWDGWITSRNVVISPVSAQDLLARILPEPKHSLNSWAWFDGVPVIFSGERWDLINVIVGEKGFGKSHLTKQLILSLAAAGVPLIITDPTAEYVDLPNVQRLAWQENFLLDLAEVGWEVLMSVVDSLHPLGKDSASEGAFRTGLAQNFKERRLDCERRGKDFTIDIPYLVKNARWPTDGNRADFVVGAIRDRLNGLSELGLFAETTDMGDIHGEAPLSLTMAEVYENACSGRPAVFDLGSLPEAFHTPLVRAVNMAVIKLARAEQQSGRGRLPYLIFDEAHEYISERALLGLITRARHLGVATTFVTNSPTKLPDAVFKLADNLIMMALHDRDDIRAVARNSFVDADTVSSFAARLKQHHAMVVGKLTDRFPLVIEIDDLPADVKKTGVTKSTWTRFPDGRIQD